MSDATEAAANAVVGTIISWAATWAVLGYSPAGALALTSRWAFETVHRDVKAKALAVTANDRAKDSPQTALQARIVSLCSGEAGMTLGVLVNRCRAFRRDDVEREVKALVAAGALRSERFKSANGKEAERFMAN